jgi:hypothetical protein
MDVPGGNQCRYSEKNKEEKEAPIEPRELEGLTRSSLCSVEAATEALCI